MKDEDGYGWLLADSAKRTRRRDPPIPTRAVSSSHLCAQACAALWATAYLAQKHAASKGDADAATWLRVEGPDVLALLGIEGR